MPISNGQVTARDIRQKAVKTLHLVDDNVTTAKLDDDAVTVAKSIAVSSYAEDFDAAGNATIDTTETQHLTVDTDVPAWATIGLFFIDTSIQVTVGGSDLTIYFRTQLDDDGVANGSGNANELPASGTRYTSAPDIKKRTVSPGSTITTGLWVWTPSGSNSSNQLALRVGAMFGKEDL